MKLTTFFFGGLALIAILLTGEYFGLNTEAQEQAHSFEPSLPNYDIRNDNSDGVADVLLRIRQASGKDAVAVAALRDGFVTGEESLKQKVPSLKVEYNNDLRIPEVISSDIKGEIEFLTANSNGVRPDTLRRFIKENGSLLGLSEAQADQLEVTADYKNPEDDFSFVHFKQKINGVPVFRGEIKAGFAKQGEVVRIINNLAPGLDYGGISTDFRNPEEAVRAAFRYVTREIKPEDTQIITDESTNLKAKFGNGDWATTAEKIYFPTEPGIAVPAWRVIIWDAIDVYMVVVDAADGAMLWRKNATEGQTQSATYNVYTNPNAMINAADSPAPFSPGPTTPNSGAQGSLKIRTNVTRIGNELPYTFNNKGWIPDGGNTTDGNAVEAGIDRISPDGIDAVQVGSPNRVFTSTWNPPPGNPAPGDDPLSTQAQRGAVIQMFYVMNLYHDELYRLGFMEGAGNFQHDNFGRGGLGGDRISAQGQDSSGFNNANFGSIIPSATTLPDGIRGRMQMYLWNGPAPDRDGTADAEVIIHEATHGTSNRLIGDGSGLTTNMSRGLGEGWSDFYAHALLSSPSDPMSGIYTIGGYATHLITSGHSANYYYGIRRFPKAILSSVGPNGKPHNPLSFRHLNSNCNTEIGTSQSIGTISAYPRGPVGSTINCSQVHNAGEIWSSALWEARAKLISRLGWEAGNRRILTLVTIGMKFTPVNPTFLQARDAIILAAKLHGQLEDAEDVWEGFRIRGMGVNASIQNTGTGINDTVVTENFDSPNLPILITPGNLNFTATADGTNPADQILEFDYSSDWTANDNASWLTVNREWFTLTKARVSVNISGLAQGTYTTSIRFDVPGAANSPVFIPVTLTVKNSPINVFPTNLNFTAIADSVSPSGQQFSIINSSNTSLTFNTSDDTTWMSVTPLIGSLPPHSSASATVIINSSGLGAGTYNGKITIKGGGVTKTVLATLTVKPNPLTLNPTSLSFTAIVGVTGPTSKQFNITNSSSLPLTFNASDDASWMSVNPPTGSIVPGASVTANAIVNSNGLATGTYNAKITVTGAGVTNEIPVTLTVKPNPPIFTINPGGLSFSADEGGSNPARQGLTITNSGGEPLKWTATSDVNWLSLSPASANVFTGGSVTTSVMVNISGLGAGVYNGTIIFSAPGAAIKQVPVQLEIF